MPYFHNSSVNLLLLHIPKTGGTSLQYYFRNKYGILLNRYSLYTYQKDEFFEGISFQHQTYKSIKENRAYFNVDFDNLEIISVVRNPYHRIISDMLFVKMISEHTTPDEVLNKLNDEYLPNMYNSEHDNHRIPQYMFLLNENYELLKNVTILKTETLSEDMKKIGYVDFENHHYKTTISRDYMDFLNETSINLINKNYEKDFQYFDYKML
jgi:hypothetical protein